jgi:hypothetical protein
MRIALLFPLLLFACAHKGTRGVDSVSAVSLLGGEFSFDLEVPTFLRLNAHEIDVSTWGIDSSLQDLVKAEAEKRGKHFSAFEFDAKALVKTAGIRESRWKKVLGRQSQAMLDQLFEAAAREGIPYFFLLTPVAEHERYPLHRGNYGAACVDSRAYIYFYFDFVLWDVKSREKVFVTTVDPSWTKATSFGDCSAVARAPDPVKSLEDPVKKTMGLVMEDLFNKMNW